MAGGVQTSSAADLPAELPLPLPLSCCPPGAATASGRRSMRMAPRVLAASANGRPAQACRGWCGRARVATRSADGREEGQQPAMLEPAALLPSHLRQALVARRSVRQRGRRLAHHSRHAAGQRGACACDGGITVRAGAPLQHRSRPLPTNHIPHPVALTAPRGSARAWHPDAAAPGGHRAPAALAAHAASPPPARAAAACVLAEGRQQGGGWLGAGVIGGRPPAVPCPFSCHLRARRPSRPPSPPSCAPAAAHLRTQGCTITSSRLARRSGSGRSMAPSRCTHSGVLRARGQAGKQAWAETAACGARSRVAARLLNSGAPLPSQPSGIVAGTRRAHKRGT